MAGLPEETKPIKDGHPLLYVEQYYSNTPLQCVDASAKVQKHNTLK